MENIFSPTAMLLLPFRKEQPVLFKIRNRGTENAAVQKIEKLKRNMKKVYSLLLSVSSGLLL